MPEVLAAAYHGVGENMDRPIEQKLRNILSGEKLPENTKESVLVKVPASLIAIAIATIEAGREEQSCKYVNGNLWY